ncbi:MAG: dihydrolipoyl dehydrogenase [Pseudomonadota bacterium]
MTEQTFDVAVIGAGPGGYTAAISAAKAGLRTVLIEAGPLGGTCLNRGCVPTKTLLHDARLLTVLRNSHFLTGRMNVDPAGIRGRKNQVVEGSRAWLGSLLAGNGVRVMSGRAVLAGPHDLEITDAAGETTGLSAANIIVSTGAAEQYPEGLAPDGRAVWNSDRAIELETIPRTLAIVGGGARAVELAQLFRHLGCRTTILERERRLLPGLDRTLAGRYKKMLQEKGIKVLTQTAAVSAVTGDDGLGLLEYRDKNGTRTAQAERILLCLPRRPNLDGLNLEAADLSPAEGRLPAGSEQELPTKGIFVIGDAAGPPYLAHKAIAQGLAAVRRILDPGDGGGTRHVPTCVYGDPEIASVGLTEAEVKASGLKYKLGEFHFIGNGRAGTMGEGQGLVRLFAEASTGRVLGVHILGPGAVEMISLAALAMENNVNLEGIKRTVFGHPTLAESFFEAALAADNQAIHMLLDGVGHDPRD